MKNTNTHRGDWKKFNLCTKNQKGLTFIEMMVAVSILAVGLTMIFKAFLICLDYMNHLTNRIYADIFLDNELITLQMQYQLTGEIPVGESQVAPPFRQTTPLNFQYAVNLYPLGELKDIYQLNIVLSWKEHGQTKSLVRSSYVSHF